MPALNWGLIQDGGVFESLMHAVLYADDPSTILFGRPGKDAGQDARTSDGTVIYQAKYRQGLVMDGAVDLALEELEKIKTYRQSSHPNFRHWQNAKRWVLFANFSINPNDDAKWRTQVALNFKQEGLAADYWPVEVIEGKLEKRPEIRDVFWGGENRVLVGLKEAHDLLTSQCIGSMSLHLPIVGRDNELSQIKAFAASGDKRVLPLIGPGGSGKSRLLYEGLVSLAQDGWRVLWGLPGSMARSSQWFRLLNGSQQTCVALDDLDDPGLLRAVIEQLAAVERRNWRVIITCRTEKAKVLEQYRTNSNVNTPLELKPLDEKTSHLLINSYIEGQAQPPWLHSIYSLTRGTPGWLCLVADLVKKGKLSDFPSHAEDVAAIYLTSSLGALDAAHHDQGLTLLRWLALWGTLRVEPKDKEQAEFRFFEKQGVPEQVARDLIKKLVDIGIVRNWGVDKRLHAIEPVIFRQQILGSWLLRENDGRYEASVEGSILVSQLLGGQVPAIDSVLNTLSQLALTRLTWQETGSFLGPIFCEMARVARDGNILDQYHIVELIEKSGAADPEIALDVLMTVRQNVKAGMDVDSPPWGPQHFSHDLLLTKIPWTLYQIAEHVYTQSVAMRYINEFRQLITLEDLGSLQTGAGKGPRQLLKRILCESKNSDVYVKPVCDLVIRNITTATEWPFIGLLAECVLNPIRESSDWVASWTISFTRRALIPGSPEWNLAAKVRGKAFTSLQTDTQPQFRGQLWRVLAESHHSFHRAVMHGNVMGAVVAQYHSVLLEDLTTCAAILRSPPIPLTIEEATQAREMWSWYLEYGRAEDLVKLARECEQIYDSLSTWRFHNFFRFDTEEELSPETMRIASILREASTLETFREFFEGAQKYLSTARQGAQDMADNSRIEKLAYACSEIFTFKIDQSTNPLVEFVVATLREHQPANQLAWTFAVKLSERYLLNSKTAPGSDVAVVLSDLLDCTNNKHRLLWGIYSNAHPSTTGELTHIELNCILGHEDGFSGHEWFTLLGVFFVVDNELVKRRLYDRFNMARDNLKEASHLMWNFIRSKYVTALRYQLKPEQITVGLILSMITEFQLDGALLGMYELEYLRERENYQLNMNEMTALIRSRIELEKREKSSECVEVVPHNFNIGKWCRFDATINEERESFQEFCNMALAGSFISLYWMPKYLAQIDPSGLHVCSFVEEQLSGSQYLNSKGLARLGYLASSYADSSTAWENIARLICERAQSMRRDERERVYFGLSKKETGVISSMPGEVSDYYVVTRDAAARLCEVEPIDSPLRGYREWALRCAEEDLRRERGCVEENAND